MLNECELEYSHFLKNVLEKFILCGMKTRKFEVGIEIHNFCHASAVRYTHTLRFSYTLCLRN